jgi:hypothetical protein
MPGMSSTALARPLGRIERFYWLLDQHVCTNFVLVARLEPGLEREDLQAALERSWARHPRLRCGIGVDPGGAVVLEPDTAGPPAVEQAPGPWRALADRELNAPFPVGSRPLLRCHWVPEDRGAAVVFTFAHGLLDGGSAATWLLELLADAAGAPPEAPYPSHPAPSDALYPAHCRGWRALLGLLGIILGVAIPRRLLGQPRPLPGAPPWGTPREPCTLQVDLDASRTSALVQRCRELGCTVQGALMAAQAIAMRAELPGDGPLPVGLAAAMDLRARLEPPLEPGTLGNHVSVLPVTVKLEPGQALGPLAASLSAELRGLMARGFGHLFWLLLPGARFLPPDARSLPRLDKMNRRAPHSTVVTNLGRLPDPPGALSGLLLELRFTMAPQQGSPLCTGVATVGGALRIDLCFDAAHVDSAGRARVARRVEEGLAALTAR